MVGVENAEGPEAQLVCVAQPGELLQVRKLSLRKRGLGTIDRQVPLPVFFAGEVSHPLSDVPQQGCVHDAAPVHQADASFGADGFWSVAVAGAPGQLLSGEDLVDARIEDWTNLVGVGDVGRVVTQVVDHLVCGGNVSLGQGCLNLEEEELSAFFRAECSGWAGDVAQQRERVLLAWDAGEHDGQLTAASSDGCAGDRVIVGFDLFRHPESGLGAALIVVDEFGDVPVALGVRDEPHIGCHPSVQGVGQVDRLGKVPVIDECIVDYSGVTAAKDDAATTLEQRQQIVETILKVWAHRRHYPGQSPLEEYAGVLAALKRLGDTRPWRFSRPFDSDFEIPDPSTSGLPLVATAAELERLTRETLIRLIWLEAHDAKDKNQQWIEAADKAALCLESRVTTTIAGLQRRAALRRRLAEGNPTSATDDETMTPGADTEVEGVAEEVADDLTAIVQSYIDGGDKHLFENDEDTARTDPLSDINHAKQLRQMADTLGKIADALVARTST